MQLRKPDPVTVSDKKEPESKKVPCRHLHLRKEYYLGAQTGDYICLDCGEKDIAPCDLPKLEEGEDRSYS